MHNGNSDFYEKKAYNLINFLDDTVPKNDYFYGVEVSPKKVESTPVYLLGDTSTP